MDAEAKLLLERVRSGGLSQDKLELAAYLGHGPELVALGTTEAPIDLGDWTERFRSWLDGASTEEQRADWKAASVRATIALARYAIELSGEVPQELSLAVDAAEDWVVDPSPESFQNAEDAVDVSIARSFEIPTREGEGVSAVGRACNIAGGAHRGSEEKVPYQVSFSIKAVAFLQPEADFKSVVSAELLPWALGTGDPVRDRVEARARAEPHDPEAHEAAAAIAAALRERMREGTLTSEQVKLAAQLGHAGARLLRPKVRPYEWPDPRFTRGWISQAAEVSKIETVPTRLAVEFAERVVSVCEQSKLRGRGRTKLEKARRAIEAARDWLECPCEEHGEAAQAAARDATRRPRMAGQIKAERRRYRAQQGLPPLPPRQPTAADYCVRAAASAARSVVRGNSAVGDAAHSAVAAVADPSAEQEWQRLRLVAYVLGEV